MIFNAILEKTPPTVRSLNPHLPPKLEEIVGKLLDKDLEMRYQTAAPVLSLPSSGSICLRRARHPKEQVQTSGSEDGSQNAYSHPDSR